MAKRRSRAKWKPGNAIASIVEMMRFVAAEELSGVRGSDIVFYHKNWSGSHIPEIRQCPRPISWAWLRSMPLHVIERSANSGLFSYAVPREGGR